MLLLYILVGNTNFVLLFYITRYKKDLATFELLLNYTD